MVKSACFMRSFARGTFCAFSKRYRAFPPPSETSRAGTARGKPTKPSAWLVGEKPAILLLINRCMARRGPGRRAEHAALPTVQAQREGRQRMILRQGVEKTVVGLAQAENHRMFGIGRDICGSSSPKIRRGFSSRS